MKVDNKGFVATALLYGLLVIFLFLIVGLLAMLSNRKMILDKLKGDIKEDLNGMTEYTVYENGTAIYYNPVTGKLCSDYTEENSKTTVTEGCMKWYVFNDNKNKSTVSMILDHNTSGDVAWANHDDFIEAGGTEKDWIAEKYNTQGPVTALKRLKDDTKKWQLSARLITADEIAHIVGADSEETIKWKQSKSFGTTVDTQSSWFYLDGSGTTYSTSNGWQKQVANESTKSNYAWLFDNISNCISYGCNKIDNDDYSYGAKDSNNTAKVYGYWTQSSINGKIDSSWGIDLEGYLGYCKDIYEYYYGIRPVITLSKKELTKSFEVTYNYTGSSQSFVRPVPGNYKIELWGAQGGGETASMNNYPGSYGGFTSGIISIQLDNKMYIFVGERPINKNHDGGYNGGGNSYYAGAGGGGATDLRLVNGNWDSFQSLSSRIMVAGAGGGGYGLTSHASGGLNGYKHRDGFINDGLGGLQTQGGVGGNNLTPSTCWNGSIIRGTVGSGKFGMGGNVILDNASYTGGTGGGSGYYGGGAGIVSCERNTGGAGAGGSSFISGHNGCVAITKDSTEENIKQRKDSKGVTCTDGTIDVTCSYHYSGLKFTDTVMIDGAGCKWTTEKTTDCSGMPTHDGTSTMTGNTGNGYAKITYLGE